MVAPIFILLKPYPGKDNHVCHDESSCCFWFVDGPTLLTQPENWNKESLDQLLGRTDNCGKSLTLYSNESIALTYIDCMNVSSAIPHLALITTKTTLTKRATLQYLEFVMFEGTLLFYVQWRSDWVAWVDDVHGPRS